MEKDSEVAQQLQEQFNRQDVGFAVKPITTCPHIPTNISSEVFIDTPCKECNELKENWQCLSCSTILCSRYVHGHMLDHFSNTKDHSVCLSYSDLSVWCFICKNYIINKALEEVKHAAYVAKFGEEPPITSNTVIQEDNNNSASASGSSSSSK
ncbi:hypothetical protein BDC45DRAFT_500642 [Circinella umbellata]|nr:hypothetical protein BDC45DRAFT_500642 [Circinella umbellata]